jgi:predicted DNA-binding transcriptional regulator AlpA
MTQRPTTLPSSSDVRMPTVQLARRFNVVPRTIERWLDDPRLAFPAPLRINGRRYWSLAEIESWERRKAAEAAAKVSA